ncbi:hypothetical protein GXY_12003 [Novacetimonas hansenii ATCC 23769]|uniref:Uncharacterized protein n=1 Tax=Novacetimonas hansenii ATCC 23769 TaxID=714995 RepID=D5QHD3_NOVHA|nr:hypothetical protein GXY_12003 [Novacetimonas hansenii ATCC 23769]
MRRTVDVADRMSRIHSRDGRGTCGQQEEISMRQEGHP